MSRLKLAFLGPPQVRHGEHIVSFPTRKTLALLVYLAVEGDMQPRATLATLLWPDSERTSARASLRTALARLRKNLAHAEETDTRPHLRVKRKAIGFNREAHHALDLQRIESALEGGSEEMQAAVDHMRGEFLQGFSLPDAPQFDDWVTYQQEQWHLRCSRLCQRLAQHLLEGGNPHGAIDVANRWLALNPLQEKAYRRLMEARAASGDRAGALQAYERCRTVLEDEIGVEPVPETVALAERIRIMGHRGKRMRGNERSGSPSASRHPSTLPLVGRAEEHSQLVEAYHQVRNGRSRLVIIEGEAGIGKTRLARYFLNWAATQGATVLQGRAYETGGRLPYQPIIDALRPAVEADVSLPTTWLAELSRLFPEIRERHPDLAAPVNDEKTAQTQLFEAVARLGKALSVQEPLLIFIDDVQWAGADSLDLLQYVSHTWSDAGAPIMIVLGLRSEALARPGDDTSQRSSSNALTRFVRNTSPVRLKLARLDKGETRDLVAALGITGEQIGPLAQWLFAETEGQPFFISETIKALLDEGIMVHREKETKQMQLALAQDVSEAFAPAPGFVAPGVRQALAARMTRLSPIAFRLLAAGAVLGQAFDYRRLCRVAGVRMEEGLAALDDLIAAHLLEETEGAERPYLFTHDKIRDVAYTEAGDARRLLYHERAYAMLNEEKAASAQIAHHALEAGLTREAFDHTMAAGDEAMALFAVRDGLAHYEEARELLQEKPSMKVAVDATQLQHLYDQVGRGYELLDEWETARRVAEEMLTVADEIGAPAMKVAALNRLAAVAIQSGADVETAADLLATAVAVAESHDDEVGLAEAEWNLAQTSYHRRDRAVAVRHGRRALELAQSLDRPKLIARAHNILSYAKNGPAPLSMLVEAEAHALAGRDIYERLGDRAMAVDCANMLGSIALHRGQPDEAVDVLTQARQMSREIENVWGQANTGFNLAQALLECGRYGEALATVQESHEAALSIDSWLTVATLTVRGNIYRALLAPDRALVDHRDVAATFAAVSNPYITHMMAGNLCVDYAVSGRWEQAHHHAQLALEHDRADAWLFSAFHEHRLVQALLRGGDVTRARKATEQFGEFISDNPRYQVPYRRAQALLAQHDGRLQAAAAHLEAALDLAEAIGLPGEQWSLLAALAHIAEERGESLQATRQRREAREIVEFIADQIDDPDLREGFLREAADAC